MRRIASYGFVAIGLLLAAAATGVFSGARAIAQTAIRAALVKNVDEPGRTPYQVRIDGSCTTPQCYITFPPVPAGKRLVMDYVSAIVGTVNQGPYLQVGLYATGDRRGPFSVLPVFVTFNDGANGTFGVNTAVHLYAEEGQAPQFYAAYSSAPSFAIFTLTGYLIDKSL